MYTKSPFLTFLEISKMDDNENDKTPTSQMISECEANVGITRTSVDSCDKEPKSAQFVHCLTSKLDGTTNGKLLDSLNFDY